MVRGKEGPERPRGSSGSGAGTLGKLSPIPALPKKMDVNAKERFPRPFRPILGTAFRSFVLPFIFTCWRCLDKLLRINFPSALGPLPLNRQVSSRPRPWQGLSGRATPAPLSPGGAVAVAVPVPTGKRCHSRRGSSRIARLSSIICQTPHNWIRPRTGAVPASQERAFYFNIFPMLILLAGEINQSLSANITGPQIDHSVRIVAGSCRCSRHLLNAIFRKTYTYMYKTHLYTSLSA